MDNALYNCSGKSFTLADTQRSLKKWAKELFGNIKIETTDCLSLCADNFAIEYNEDAVSCY